MDDTPLPPPGWYGDPAGAHGSRWWDGAAWTDHVREAPPGDEPPPAPGVVDAGSDLPLSGPNRRVGLLVLAALVIGLVATAVVGLRTAGPSPLERADGGPVGEVSPGAEVPPPLQPDEVADRAEAAGCRTVVDGAPLEDRTHLDPDEAPPAEALYPDRPAHSGRHYGTLLPLPVGTATVPVDERAVLHNMEHGAVVVWFDADVVDEPARDRLAAWRDSRSDLGFTSARGGAIWASPMPELDDPPAVALRAWGVAVDCDGFDPMVADAFLAEHWGTHGVAPEANLSPYPEGSIRLRDRA